MEIKEEIAKSAKESLLYKGMKCFRSPALDTLDFVQFRFPKSKKKRIRKKWKKNSDNGFGLGEVAEPEAK